MAEKKPKSETPAEAPVNEGAGAEYLVLSESYPVECIVRMMGEDRKYITRIPAGVRYEVVEFSDVEVDPYANTILRTTLARIAGEIKRV